MFVGRRVVGAHLSLTGVAVEPRPPVALITNLGLRAQRVRVRHRRAHRSCPHPSGRSTRPTCVPRSQSPQMMGPAGGSTFLVHSHLTQPHERVSFSKVTGTCLLADYG